MTALLFAVVVCVTAAPPMVDLLANYAGHAQSGMPTDGLGDYGADVRDQLGAHRYVSLHNLLKRCVTAPLQAQSVPSVTQCLCPQCLGHCS